MMPVPEPMGEETLEMIRTRVLRELYDLKKTGRRAQSIVASPENYHLCLVAFVHQVTISENGVELLGVPLVIDRNSSDIQVRPA
jgi:hypothetical protein